MASAPQPMTTSPVTAPPTAALSASAPCFLVQNAGSGRQEPAHERALLERELAAAGRRFRFWEVSGGAALQRAAREAVDAARAEAGVVVAAGGDGTINSVVGAALGRGCPVGVLPQGTFNFFARTHGIPTESEAAIRTVLDTFVRPVPIGLVNDRVFLVNASLGLYPQLIEDREAYYAGQAGRHRLVALWAGLGTLLREHRQLRLRLEKDGRLERDIRTPTVFVGNNRLQLEQIGIPEAAEVESGRLAVIALRPVGTLQMLGLLVRGALGRLGDADKVVSFSAEELTVRPARRFGMARAKVAIDGELGWLQTPLRFRVAPDRLPLLVPRPPPGGPAGEAASAGRAAG
jgi:diacylglycerol kinase family enzyme